ncbi:hypothetical protein C8R46DRAFT_1103706 [Mycena filopes]|nr:hypothetical protein C8R46DRAFT_1103699 [Mycena filopes]KAJ7162152.1 hypothetical protein C8R46DRAFT_1103706 [Mycena filopes]
MRHGIKGILNVAKMMDLEHIPEDEKVQYVIQAVDLYDTYADLETTSTNIRRDRTKPYFNGKLNVWGQKIQLARKANRLNSDADVLLKTVKRSSNSHQAKHKLANKKRDIVEGQENIWAEISAKISDTNDISAGLDLLKANLLKVDDLDVGSFDEKWSAKHLEHVQATLHHRSAISLHDILEDGDKVFEDDFSSETTSIASTASNGLSTAFYSMSSLSLSQ